MTGSEPFFKKQALLFLQILIIFTDIQEEMRNLHLRNICECTFFQRVIFKSRPGSIKTQMDDIYGNYKFVENLTTLQLENIGTVLGDPIQTELRASFDPLFGELGDFQTVLDGVTTTLTSVDKNLAKISSSVQNFEGTLETIKASIEADLAFENCDKNAACSMLKGFTAKLQLGGNFQSVSFWTEIYPELGQVADFFKYIYYPFLETVSFFFLVITNGEVFKIPVKGE